MSLGDDSGDSRYTCAAFGHCGKPLAARCDVNGQWSVVCFTIDPTQQTTAPLPTSSGGGGSGGSGGGGGGGVGTSEREVRLRGSEDLGEPYEIAPSPTDSVIAISTHDLRLLLLDTNSGVVRRLDGASFECGIFDVTWSLDGRWLAYAVATSSMSRTSAIRLCEVSTGQVVAITDGLTRDTCPSFDPHAKCVPPSPSYHPLVTRGVPLALSFLPPISPPCPPHLTALCATWQVRRLPLITLPPRHRGRGHVSAQLRAGAAAIFGDAHDGGARPDAPAAATAWMGARGRRRRGGR